MMNLVTLTDDQVNDILEAAGYSSNGILTTDYVYTDEQGRAYYKALWLDEYTDEFGFSKLVFENTEETVSVIVA